MVTESVKEKKKMRKLVRWEEKLKTTRVRIPNSKPRSDGCKSSLVTLADHPRIQTRK